MLDHHEELLQLHGDLHHRRQHDQECTLLLAGNELMKGRLDDFWVVEKAMKVMQEQECAAVLVGQGRQGAQCGSGSLPSAVDSGWPLLDGSRNPWAMSQIASFHLFWAVWRVMSRSASSGSCVCTHKPVKAALM